MQRADAATFECECGERCEANEIAEAPTFDYIEVSDG